MHEKNVNFCVFQRYHAHSEIANKNNMSEAGTRAAKRQCTTTASSYVHGEPDPKMLLPKSGTTWHVIFQNPDLFLTLMRIASPVLTAQIRFYPTIRRGFTGILIDEFAPGNVALMIGRLCCPVFIAGPTGECVESGEIEVVVSTAALMATLKGTNAIQCFAMYQRPDSANLFFAILESSSSGHVIHDDIVTCIGTHHSTLKTLKFQHELTIPAKVLKDDIGRAAAKKIAEVTLRLARAAPDVFILIMTGSGDLGNAFAAFPIETVPIQERIAGQTESEGTSSSVNNLVQTVAQLTADARGQFISDTSSFKVVIPKSRDELEALPIVYRGIFSVKYLEKMITPLKDDSEITVFLGNRPTLLPLILRFDLDIKDGVESYVSFVLAANQEGSS